MINSAINPLYCQISYFPNDNRYMFVNQNVGMTYFQNFETNYRYQPNMYQNFYNYQNFSYLNYYNPYYEIQHINQQNFYQQPRIETFKNINNSNIITPSKRKSVPIKLKRIKDIKSGVIFKMKPICYQNNNEILSSIVIHNFKNIKIKESSKYCLSCGCIDTPLWRDIPVIIKQKYISCIRNKRIPALCNACGIRWKKYQTKCTLCDHIPKKYQRNLKYCYNCKQSSIQKYVFQ